MKHLFLTICAMILSMCSFAAIGPITGDSTICSGACTGLSNNTPGGMWSSSNTAIATISGSGFVCGITAGNVTVTYATTTDTAYFSMVISLSPGPIIGMPYPLCLGSSTVLSDATPGGTWLSSNTSVTIDPITGAMNAVWVGSSVISYNVPASTTSGGCSMTANATVINTACPGPGAITSLVRLGCTNDTLSVPGFCDVAYQWQFSTDNITWNNIAGATNAIYVFNPAASYYYRCGITCSSSGTLSYSSTSMINISSPVLHATINPIPDTVCPDMIVKLNVCGPPGAYNVTTYFGDGTSSNVTLASSTLSGNINHTYATSGNYTIKHILYNGTVPVDTVTYSYEYLYCRMQALKLYIDNNSNCTFDPGEIYNFIPVKLEIDSNGIIIDTLSVTGGLYYKMFGGPGTVYAFKLLSNVSMSAACPASGILYDTIDSYVNAYPEKYLGIEGAPSGSFDLSTKATMRCGRHLADGSIYVSNLRSTPQSGVLTLNFSSKYQFTSSNSVPASITSNSVSWNLANLSSAQSVSLIAFRLEVPSTWLLPGDTINTTYTISPTTGDANLINNYVARIDTVKASYDPNYIEADPAGYILPGAEIPYTIHFENTGNDTAQNIYVMDTLSDNLDARSLEIVCASATMNVTQINDGMHNIVKFDFPNIKLLDSSYHGQCDGFVSYRIMPKSGLPDGSAIFAHAGIFFDDNPVVLTERIENVIAYLNGPTSVCIGNTVTMTELAQGGTWTSSNANATVAGGVVTGVTIGSASISYTRTYSNGPISVSKSISITDCPTGVLPIEADNDLVIYPNPTNGLLTIITDNGAYSSFTITNVAGQEMMQQQMNARQTDVHIDKLAAGIYYITLKGKYGVTVKKITKM